MTHSKSKAPNYPKSHLLAASGVAALLSLALLVFPSREVEAKKTFLDLRLSTAEDLATPQQDLPEPGATKESPFAAIEPSAPAAAGDTAAPEPTIAAE